MTKEAIRIVFMGTPEFAVTILDGLLQHNYKVVGVITAPDRPAGRGQKIHGAGTACPICARRCLGKTAKTHPNAAVRSARRSGCVWSGQRPARFRVPCGSSCACDWKVQPKSRQNQRSRCFPNETAE